MDEENIEMENEDSYETSEDTSASQEDETVDAPQGEDEQQEDVEDLKARLAKAEELADNYKIRAEKAERVQKTKKVDAPAENKKTELSQGDLIALIRADIPEDDIAEVTDYAKLKNISVSEALKSTTVKAILKERAEVRQSAAATNTAPARRGTSQVTTESLLEDAKKGIMPENDADINRLVDARLGLIRNKK